LIVSRARLLLREADAALYAAKAAGRNRAVIAGNGNTTATMAR
jgi:GGDEF domain-containing protein